MLIKNYKKNPCELLESYKLIGPPLGRSVVLENAQHVKG